MSEVTPHSHRLSIMTRCCTDTPSVQCYARNTDDDCYGTPSNIHSHSVNGFTHAQAEKACADGRSAAVHGGRDSCEM